MTPSPFLTAQEAADYLRLPNTVALHSFLFRRRRAGFPVTTYRLGRNLRFKRSDLDAAMSVEKQRALRVSKR